MNLPWCEKHRPLTLDDIVGNEVAIKRLKAFCHSGLIPNLVVSGPSGTGKTSAICALSHDWQHGVIEATEMNASDERGIDAVRTRIKEIVCKKSFGLKLVILDEADGLTSSAQHALKSIMDRYSDAVFAFSCNDLSKLLPQIQSRCSIILLEKLTTDIVRVRLKHVSNKENVPHTAAGLKAIAEFSNGDCRSAINMLQTLARSARVTSLTCHAMFGLDMKELVRKCLYYSAKPDTLDKMYALIKDICIAGYSLGSVCHLLTNEKKLFDVPKVGRERKIKLCQALSCHHMRSAHGDNSFLHICSLFNEIRVIMISSESQLMEV